MSLARAFTTRRAKVPEISAPLPNRSMTTKHFAAGTIRSKISGPVELLSTTNMLSYNAPDIYPRSSTSSQSGDDSDSLLPTLTSSPATSPDTSSAGSAPNSPEPNHLSCYFGTSSGRQSTSSTEDAPTIPQRASSHTKRQHELVSRKRSRSRLSGKDSSITSFARDSASMFTSTHLDSIPSGPEPHPFGNELAQVTELAEEYGSPSVDDHADAVVIVDEEELELRARGLFKFEARDYMEEIECYFWDAFAEPPVAMPVSMWI